MKGKSINEFMETLYLCGETEYIFNDNRYFIQVWKNDAGSYTLSLDEINPNVSSKEILMIIKEKISDCISVYEKSAIYNGKNIYDAENDITVIYG